MVENVNVTLNKVTMTVKILVTYRVEWKMKIFENTQEAAVKLQKLEKNGTNYVVFGDEIERKTGFERGSVMSVFINNLKKIKETQPNIKVAIKNTTEDLDFYSHILRKLPDVYFMFDREYANKYSKYSMDEWTKFASDHNTI